MHKSLNLLILTVMFLGFSSGCARFEAEERSVQIQDLSSAYRKAIRWSEFEVAKDYIRHRDGSEFDYDKVFHERIKVTSMEIIKRNVSIENLEAQITAELSYYHLDHGSVKSIVDMQLWWYDAETERWYLDGDFPAFADGLSN